VTSTCPHGKTGHCERCPTGRAGRAVALAVVASLVLAGCDTTTRPSTTTTWAPSIDPPSSYTPPPEPAAAPSSVNAPDAQSGVVKSKVKAKVKSRVKSKVKRWL
jgi:hypothetical protein